MKFQTKAKNGCVNCDGKTTTKEIQQYSKAIGYITHSERREIEIMITTSKRVAASTRMSK